jgi:hypothetical protein
MKDAGMEAEFEEYNRPSFRNAIIIQAFQFDSSRETTTRQT